jgi:predicted ATPase
MTHRFGPRGLYLLDESEAALSVRGCVAVLTRLADLTRQGCQIMPATTRRSCSRCPATIYQLDETGESERVDYDQALPVQLAWAFLSDNPDKLAGCAGGKP